MARFQIPASTPYVGLGCCWFLSFALRGFPPGTPVFSFLQKPAFPNFDQISESATSNYFVIIFTYLLTYLFTKDPFNSTYYIILYFSIYTLSDLGELSNLIGLLSRTIQQFVK